MAGNQPDLTLSQRPEAGEGPEPAGFLDRHEGKARHLLEDRSGDDRGQPDAAPRARRESADAAGALGPGQARHRPRLPRRRFELPRQRARAVRVELPQGRRRYRYRLCRQREAFDQRLVRPDRRFLPQAPGLSILAPWIPLSSLTGERGVSAEPIAKYLILR